ncbi:MAG: hypothetical protein JXA77_05220 [Bacteroidales bacterium]|nr:hypothetical protein [Bacteroidales bacterium]MBN2820449.1 hypothetical protein [Bacteroidales bacterium]
MKIILKSETILFLLVFVALLSACKGDFITKTRYEIDLSGKWQFALDEEQKGISEKWFLKSLDDEVILPGSLDENLKGLEKTDTVSGYLNRPVYYTGLAWYQKELVIPEEWDRKYIELIMERTKVTKVWIDSTYIGSSDIIYTPQRYDLTDNLAPGKHIITIAVDNREELVPVAGSHAYSENTQTNWNGIIGRFCLEAANIIRIKQIKVTPDIENNSVKVYVKLANREKAKSLLSVSLMAEAWNTRNKPEISGETYIWPDEKEIDELEVVYSLGDKINLWSEYSPALYKLEVTLNQSGVPVDNQFVDFGLREFKTSGTKFTINGDTTFLRGKHDACVFPLTGYPPTTVDEWLKVFRIAQSWGLNHYRYHTWTPPEAAFKAADICGIYMQSELPMWWGFDDKDQNQVNYLTSQGKLIMDEYANYASFVLFSLGNELFQERTVLQQMVADIRAHDSRPLFTTGSNNRLWDPSWAEGDDFFVSFRAAKDAGDNSTDVRTSMSYLDSKYGGILNAKYPSTSFNYSRALTHSPVPVIGFEVGQYQVYPDFSEISKYKGVLKPWNLEYFKKKLQETDMFDQVEDFFLASGKLSALCYRADIEAAIRTPEFGGFHLLDLQDYPGQGTALVGMLDAFMDNKGLIEPEEFKNFCNDVVVLLEMDKFSWQSTDTFRADIKVANYSGHDISKSINWQITGKDFRGTISAGEFNNVSVRKGEVNYVGSITFPLKDIDQAERFDISLELGTKIQNNYPLWFYPEKQEIADSGIITVDRLTMGTINKLVSGHTVLLFPDSALISGTSVGSQFISDFWNYDMFKKLGEQYGGGLSPGTMGILTNPEHAIFKAFPTEFHTNWQWWPMVSNCQSLILDGLTNYRPVVQIIDNINRNHKLGMIMEFSMGEGKLLVCAANLPELSEYPEAKQLYVSIVNYMLSDDFMPEYDITVEQLKTLGLVE